MPPNIDAFNILGYGVIGLGFLLAFLAYRLLGREQQREVIRRSILVAIHVFMIFSVVLCVIGFGSEYIRRLPAGGTGPDCDDLRTQLAQKEQELKTKQDELESKVTENTSQALLLQRYRERAVQKKERAQRYLGSLRTLAGLSIVPPQFREALNQLIDLIVQPPVEPGVG